MLGKINKNNWVFRASLIKAFARKKTAKSRAVTLWPPRCFLAALILAFGKNLEHEVIIIQVLDKCPVCYIIFSHITFFHTEAEIFG